jgi:anti-sigma B factor antagonist
MLADVEFAVHGRALVAALQGEIDLSNAGELRMSIVAFISSEADGIVLDLSEVDFLDSAGIQLIYHLREDLRARGQALSLVIPPGCAVDDALRLAGMKGQARTFEAIAEALDDAAGARESR